MKKINIGQVRHVLLLICLLTFSNCRKPEIPEPVQDTELQTSIDASWANFVVSDIEMICSFAAEDASTYPKFYTPASGSSGLGLIRDASRISINFNQTTCIDGHVRDGAIFIFFNEPQFMQHPATGNENYIRDYNFTGRISLQDYRVDGWLVDEKDFSAFIKNLRPDATTPVAAPLRWSFEGTFNMKRDQESMSWSGKFTKTLVNTNDPMVFNPNAQMPINWPNAVITYTGSATGTTPGHVPFEYSIFSSNPLTRDFSCYPDPVLNVNLGGISNSAIPEYSEFHPFTAGVIEFNTGSAYSRLIYYANEHNTFGGANNPDLILPVQCDNKATVQIKGVYHAIDLKK